MTHRLLALILIAAAFPVMAGEQPPKAKAPKPGNEVVIDIKGFRIGMSATDAEELYRTLPSPVTIAGAPAKYETRELSLMYDDGKLSNLMFFFTADHFDEVRDALKAKFPTLRCETGQVSNRMGAKFPQQECILIGGDTLLTLTRIVSDIQTSSLTLASIRKLAREAGARRNAAAKDL